jgi:predicted metal-dependent phosphoesterase TrpH
MTTPIRDLHTHSNCSDGLYDPAELVRQAARSGVEELSLTDHDTLAGLEEAQAQAVSLSLRFMPGIEFTCRFDGRTVHVLGYGFRPSVALGDRHLTAYLEQVRASDLQWAAEMCRKSCTDPILVRPPAGGEFPVCVREDELAWARGTMPSPFHIAVVLAEKLAALSDELRIPARHCMYLLTGRPERRRQGESYWPELRARYAPLLDRYHITARPHWGTARPTAILLDAGEAIRTIERIGGIAVLAHPGEQKLTGGEIEALAGLGIRGLEVYTFKHSASLISELERLAKRRGLFTTSGSDFHDPHHRAQVELGKDRAGKPLTRGLSLDGFRKLGAHVAGLP